MAFVKTEVQGAVEIITIDRPKALNALNPEVLADLKAAFEAVDQDYHPLHRSDRRRRQELCCRCRYRLHEHYDQGRGRGLRQAGQ